MLFSRFIVSGPSMEPVFYAGDRLLVLNSNLFLGKGNVVVLRGPRDGRLVLKRVMDIKNGQYFVKGDNDRFSTDSRVFGPVPSDNLIGKVLFRYYRSTGFR